MTEIATKPDGDLLFRSLAMPADTNVHCGLFGGWITSQMEIGGGILAKKMAGGRVVTVAVEATSFHRPVQIGHVVCCYGRCIRIGNTSMTIQLQVCVKLVVEESPEERYLVTEAVFTYVASVPQGKPTGPKRDSAGCMDLRWLVWFAFGHSCLSAFSFHQYSGPCCIPVRTPPSRDAGFIQQCSLIRRGVDLVEVVDRERIDAT